ncbi:MAG: hypothetical protein WKH68_13085 [Candidatus Limnocylindria bacterium]
MAGLAPVGLATVVGAKWYGSEIKARRPTGFPPDTVRIVNENAVQLVRPRLGVRERVTPALRIEVD